ncbi:TerC family protein [Microvirga massiliensis]|uniref:TerC family protein n=1 Tax=Microvirga massiliensis TaxID=1033741 RepID=UPI000B29EC48|nr:recombinase family protein [Microvirga massiliensis]
MVPRQSWPAFLFTDWLGKPAWTWLAFLGLVVALLVLDLGVLHRKHHEIGVHESLLMSAFYIALGFAFGGWVWWYIGPEPGMSYLTGFEVEKALAMDNVFVIAMIFSFFAVPRLYQHRVLFWGILGVIVLRGIMIGFGAAVISQFSWVLYIFAAFLIATGVKMLVFSDKEYDIAKNPAIGFMRRHFNVTDEHHGEHFFVRKPEMNLPEKIHSSPLERLAVVYVRQSTLQQVERHQESTRLQYGLAEQARHYGWSPERGLVIDDDLGCSGTTAEGRLGFQRLVTEVGLGHVGLVLGIEMSRLARSCSAILPVTILTVAAIRRPSRFSGRPLPFIRIRSAMVTLLRRVGSEPSQFFFLRQDAARKHCSRPRPH